MSKETYKRGLVNIETCVSNLRFERGSVGLSSMGPFTTNVSKETFLNQERPTKETYKRGLLTIDTCGSTLTYGKHALRIHP